MLIIQKSAKCEIFVFRALAVLRLSPYIPPCAEHGAGLGRSRAERLYEEARKG